MNKLSKANEYVAKNHIAKEELPVFHVTPPCGWMNDPNGFSAFQGKAHLFYQFHPYSIKKKHQAAIMEHLPSLFSHQHLPSPFHFSKKQ